MKILLKNMVCNRCKLVVESILANLNLPQASIKLGAVKFHYPLSKQQLTKFKNEILLTGLEIVDDKRSQLQEQIKLQSQEYLNKQLFHQNTLLSDYLSEQLHKDYCHISRLFSSIESVSIEQYYLALRMEKVKEYISYQQLSFSEIAYDLGFSSVAHLSKQFKKLTGLTLSEFKQSHAKLERTSLDNIKIM